MFFKSLIKTLNTSYSYLNYNGYDDVDPNIVKYFRTEYGSDWKAALDQYMRKENLNNDKKAA